MDLEISRANNMATLHLGLSFFFSLSRFSLEVKLETGEILTAKYLPI